MLIRVTCPLCDRPGPAPCDRCVGALAPARHLPPVAGLDGLRARFCYEGAVRELVAALKYRNARRVAGRLAEELAPLVVGDPLVVTWVPAAPANRRARGYDQGEVLARPLARVLGLPARRLLVRRGTAQTRRGRSARLAGPDLSARRRVPARVLVVDDVVTTGASLAAAAGRLHGAGARAVTAVVVAARQDRTFGISKPARGAVPSCDRSPYGG